MRIRYDMISVHGNMRQNEWNETEDGEDSRKPCVTYESAVLFFSNNLINAYYLSGHWRQYIETCQFRHACKYICLYIVQ